MRVRVDATVAPSAQINRTLSSDARDGPPSISRSGGAAFPNHHCIVFDRPGAGVHAVLVDSFVATVAGPHVVTNRADAAAVAVDGDGTDFFVAWQQGESPTSTEHDVYDQKIRRSGSSMLNIGTATPISADAAVDERTPAVGFVGRKYVVAWSDRVTPDPFGYDIAVREFDVDGCVPCGPEHTIDGAGRYDFGPRIGTEASGGSFDQTGARIAFSSAAAQPPFRSEVHAHRYDAFGAGGSIVQIDAGCGTPGTWSVNGPAAIGNGDFQFQLTGADPATTLAIFTVNIPRPPIACGTCNIIPGFMSASVPYNGSFAAMQLPIPSNEGLVGGRLQMQWIMIGGSQSPCPLVSNLSVGSRVNVTIGL